MPAKYEYIIDEIVYTVNRNGRIPQNSAIFLAKSAEKCKKSPSPQAGTSYKKGWRMAKGYSPLEAL